MINNASSVITAINKELFVKAQFIAKEFNIPFTETIPENCEWYLILTDKHLELRHYQNKLGNPIYIDFLQGKSAYRAQHGGGKNQLIAKAVGIKSSFKPTVLDVTAGLGRDAFILASLGCKVHMIERSPIIAALLADGLQRANENSEFKNNISLSLTRENSLLYLTELSQQSANKPDVIYLDPMYPERTKSALVKKELRILKEIVGDDDDASELLSKSLSIANKRVVVKRPTTAAALNEYKPDLIYKSINTRFDVYFPIIGKSK